jgi:MFS family permease
VIQLLGLAQVPFYLAYGLLSSLSILLALFCLHGTIYALMMPSVDTHVATAAPSWARARTQSLYSAVGLAGAFIAANGLDWLYARHPRLPVMLVGLGYGCCVLLGGFLVRRWERGQRVAGLQQAVQVA